MRLINKIIITLLMSPAWMSETWAQPGLPADFIHPVDTIYVIASPVDGGKQTLFKLNSLDDLSVTVDYIKYNIVVSSPSNGEPFSRYVRVMGVEAGALPEAGDEGPTIDLQMTGCLVMVPKNVPGVNSAPIMKDGLGARTGMFEQGDWYYCYVKFTKLGQKFTCNPDNSYNGDVQFWPAQNSVIIMSPKREVTIQTQFK